MTDEEIDALKPGVGMDAIVAREIFGWHTLEIKWTNGVSGIVTERWFAPPEITKKSCAIVIPPCPEYSTNIQDAWMIVEKMHSYNFDLHHFNKPEGFPPHRNECIIRKTDYVSIGIGENMPEAICKAALKGCNYD